MGEQIDKDMGSPEMKPSKGKRSSAFNFLLDEEYYKPIESKYTSKKRDNYEQYVTDLSGGDIRLGQERAKIVEAEKQEKAERRSKLENASTAISDKDRELLSAITPEERDEILKQTMEDKERVDQILNELDEVKRNAQFNRQINIEKQTLTELKSFANPP